LMLLPWSDHKQLKAAVNKSKPVEVW
jgi:hypothetical protein